MIWCPAAVIGSGVFNLGSMEKEKIINSYPRVVNNAHSYRCLKCNSSAGKTGFLGLFGEILCDNKRCENSKKRFKKL